MGNMARAETKVQQQSQGKITWNNSLVGFKTKSGNGIRICEKQSDGSLKNIAYLHERTSKNGKTYFSYANIG